jgi:hypothetical protein
MAMARRLAVDHTLRLYRNPFKQLLYLLVSLGFVAVGVWMFSDPKVRADTPRTVIAYLTVGFFGLGVVVFLFSLARALLVRRPLLQVDAHGWTYDPPLGRNGGHVPWEDIGRVVLFCQHMPSRFRSDRRYFFVLEARHPDQVRHSRVRAFTNRLLPVFSQSLMGFSVNDAFMRTTPEKVERLLQRIQAEFSDEFHRYGIEVIDAIENM